MYVGFQGGPQSGPNDTERGQYLGQLYVWSVLFCRCDARTDKSFLNLIKSNQNQIVFTIFPLIGNQTDVRLVPNQSVYGKYNQTSVWFNNISKSICCPVYYIGPSKSIEPSARVKSFSQTSWWVETPSLASCIILMKLTQDQLGIQGGVQGDSRGANTPHHLEMNLHYPNELTNIILLSFSEAIKARIYQNDIQIWNDIQIYISVSRCN